MVSQIGPFAVFMRIAIDETISLELHVIEINELVAARDAIEVSEPRQISRLMDRQDHLN